MWGGVIDSRPLVLVCWLGARSSCAVHFEEGPDDGYRYSFNCCAILGESFADHYVNTSDRIGHPDRRRTDHNRHFPGIGHRHNSRGGRLIFFGYRCGNGRRLDSSHHHGADDLVIVVARYPDSGRIAVRPDESMYSWARSGEPGPSLCG